MRISVQTPVVPTARLQQMCGLFDLNLQKVSGQQWDVDLKLPDEWNVGVVVGPSGCGKSTILKHLWPDQLARRWEWPEDKCVLDGFPKSMSVRDVVAWLNSVGFSSPPSWVRPFRVLSNGEQFRVTMARMLAEMPDIAVVDEFTSVVDRTVAKIGSCAIAKTVRARNQKLVVGTCHHDVLEWMQPDWMFEPAIDRFTVGRCLRRPSIELLVCRVSTEAWQLFRKHHYLNTELLSCSKCFVAFWNGEPVALTAITKFVHPLVRNMWREHRTVTLPDYQGVGIGNALSAFVGSVLKALFLRFSSVTSHPAMIASRMKSPLWKCERYGTRLGTANMALCKSAHMDYKSSWKRLTSSFEYVGPAADRDLAVRLFEEKVT